MSELVCGCVDGRTELTMLTAAEISTIRPRRSGLEVSDCQVGMAVVSSAAILNENLTEFEDTYSKLPSHCQYHQPHGLQ